MEICSKRLNEVNQKIENIYGRQMEFSQSRTAFQIEKFIGCSEYTPVTRYRHLITNQYALLKSLKKNIIEKERLSRKISKKEVDNSENSDLDLLELNMKLEDIEITISGQTNELTIFEQLIQKLEEEHGGPFTYVELEEDQPNYWEIRLATQCHNIQSGTALSIGAGNYEAICQALEAPILDNKNLINKIKINSYSDLAKFCLENKGIAKHFLAE